MDRSYLFLNSLTMSSIYVTLFRTDNILFSKKGRRHEEMSQFIIWFSSRVDGNHFGLYWRCRIGHYSTVRSDELVTIATSTNQIDLTWSASTDGVGVIGYNVYRDGIYLKSETTISTLDSGLTVSTQYCYQITAYDASKNESAKCAQVCLTTQTSTGTEHQAPDTTTPDTTAPSIPTDLVTTATSTSQIILTWTASIDDVGVTGYKVYRDGIYIKSEATISTLDSGLNIATRYCYQISAYDKTGNESIKCTEVCATTLMPGLGQTQSYKIYSFEGAISNLYDDWGGVITTRGYKVGDYIFAKYFVDFSEKGFYILNNGEVIIPEDPQFTNDPHWYFFNTLIDGTVFPELNGGLYNGPGDIGEYHVAYNSSGPAGNSSLLQGGSGNSNISIFKESWIDTSIENWVIGEPLKGIVMVCSDTGCSVMWADMIVTNIQVGP